MGTFTPEVIAYIGVGSNLESPLNQVRTALRELRGLACSRVVCTSALYRTPPMGPPDQPAYINAVVELGTRLAPLALLHALLDIEREHGRVRTGRKWGPRTLDLDILLYGDRIIRAPRLTVPHPGIAERAFVLVPLHDIAPELEVPGLGAVAELRDHCDVSEIERLTETAPP